jgi:hypothetical protein
MRVRPASTKVRAADSVLNHSAKAIPATRRVKEAAPWRQIEHRPEIRGLLRVRIFGEHLSPDPQVLEVEERLPPFIHGTLVTREYLGAQYPFR